jgi:hypothetical protein
VEIADSHEILGGTGRHRPSAVIVGSFLFVGSDGATGPTIERYKLLR